MIYNKAIDKFCLCCTYGISAFEGIRDKKFVRLRGCNYSDKMLQCICTKKKIPALVARERKKNSIMNSLSPITTISGNSNIASTAYNIADDQGFCQADAEKHLRYLGHDINTTSIRLLATDEPAKKLTGLDLTEIKKRENRGYSVHAVVNQGGQTDLEITSCTAIFYEHDNLEIGLQLDLWRSLQLPVPTFQIATGGKSIHSYWVFDQPTSDKLGWQKLQKDLLEYADADRQLGNLSKMMRLAGSGYFKDGKLTGRATFASESGVKYSFSQLRELIPVAKVEKPSHPEIPLYANIPLSVVLSTSDRDLIDRGAGQGERNCQGAKLARGIIGAAQRVNYLFPNYSFDNERKYFDDFCNHCNPPLGTKEADLIWSAAYKDNPTSTLTDLAIENCIKSYLKQQSIPGISNNIIPVKSLSAKGLRDKIDEIVKADLEELEVRFKLHELADECKKSVKELTELYNATKAKFEEQSDKQALEKIAIPKLFEAKKTRLSGFDFLYGDGGYLAALLHEAADTMPTAFEHLFTTLLPTVGSCIGTSSTIIINSTETWSQPSIFQTLILGKSGDLKSPSQKLIIKPLQALEDIERQKYQKELERYKSELATYKADADATSEPEKPVQRRFIVNDLTQEAKVKLHCENPRGLLQFRDEWSGYISGRNKFRGGNGDDIELELSEFDGVELRRDRVSAENSGYVSKSAINKTGNTQIDTLLSILTKQGFDDSRGEFSRWLPCLVSTAFKEIDLFAGDTGLNADITKALTNLYSGCLNLPEKQYFLSDPAKKLTQDMISKLRNLNRDCDDPGWTSIYPKIQGYLCRFILWLHLTNHVLAGNINPPQVIDKQCVQSAGKLIKFYLDQHTLLKALFVPEQKIEGDYLKIQEYLERKQAPKSASELKAGVRSLNKVSSKEIYNMANQLVGLGILCISEDNKRFFAPNFIDKIDVFDQKIDKSGLTKKMAKNLTKQGGEVDLKNKKIDKIDKKLTPIKTAESLDIQRGEVGQVNQKLTNSPPPTLKTVEEQEIDNNLDNPQNPEKPEISNSYIEDCQFFESKTAESLAVQRGEVVNDLSILSISDESKTAESLAVQRGEVVLENVNFSPEMSILSAFLSIKIGDRYKIYPTYRHYQDDKTVVATVTDVSNLEVKFSYTEKKYDKKEQKTISTRKDAIIGLGSADWILRKV